MAAGIPASVHLPKNKSKYPWEFKLSGAVGQLRFGPHPLRCPDEAEEAVYEQGKIS